MKEHKRTLHMHHSSFSLAAEEFSWIIHELNEISNPDPFPNRDRVKAIVELMRTFERVTIEMRMAMFQTHDLSDFEESRRRNAELLKQPTVRILKKKAEKAVKTLNHLLTGYVWAPSIGTRHDWTIYQCPRFGALSSAARDEHLAISILLSELEAERVHRFRRCSQCNQWLYAITEHQRFCDEKCRKKFASGSSEYKKKRALFMREYRKREKLADASARILATRKDAR